MTSEKKSWLGVRAAAYFATGFAAGRKVASKLAGSSAAEKSLANGPTGDVARDNFVKSQASFEANYHEIASGAFSVFTGVLFTGIGLTTELFFSKGAKKQEQIPDERVASVTCGNPSCRHQFTGTFYHYIGDRPRDWVVGQGKILEYGPARLETPKSQFIKDAVIECPECKKMNSLMAHWSSSKKKHG